ncbi:MAG: hypothetical protein U1C46_06230 [Bacteroidales bacterium]|nr:hypothetical protein [Bacteroidales bacterium]
MMQTSTLYPSFSSAYNTSGKAKKSAAHESSTRPSQWVIESLLAYSAALMVVKPKIGPEYFLLAN